MLLASGRHGILAEFAEAISALASWDMRSLSVAVENRVPGKKRISVDAKSPIHSLSVAGLEIFVSHNSGRITSYPEVTPKWVLSCLPTTRELANRK